MSVRDFWDSTYRDVVKYIEGYNKKVAALDRAEWERIRWQTAALLQPYVPKGQKLKLTDLMRFQDEIVSNKQTTDPEKIRAINEKWDLEIAKKFNVNGQ